MGASILAFLLLGETPGCAGGGACPSPTTMLVLLGSVLVLAGIYVTARESLRGPRAAPGIDPPVV